MTSQLLKIRKRSSKRVNPGPDYSATPAEETSHCIDNGPGGNLVLIKTEPKLEVEEEMNSGVFSEETAEQNEEETLAMVSNFLAQCQVNLTPDIYNCNDCGKNFSRREYFVAHARIHLGFKQFSCTECGRRFTQQNHLDMHRRTHTQEKPFTCNECNHSFARKATLELHLKMHFGLKEFTCPECQKIFRTKYQMTSHVQRHGAQRRTYRCLDCNSTFTERGNLRKHIRSRNGGNVPFPDRCGNKVAFRYPKDKPKVCEFCNKSFKTWQHVNRHILVHTGDKPLQCKYCPKTFKTHSNLISHTRVHTKETPFICSNCGTGFFQRHHLIYHIEKKRCQLADYICSECNFKFFDVASLFRHSLQHTRTSVTGRLFRVCRSIFD